VALQSRNGVHSGIDFSFNMKHTPMKPSAPSKKSKSEQVPKQPSQQPSPLLVYGLPLLIGFIFFGIVSVLMGKDNNWDLRNYHYYNPYSFFHGRLGFDYAPAQLQSFLNPGQDFIFYFLITHFKPIVAGFLMGGIHGLGFGLIFVIAYRVFSSKNLGMRIGISLCCAAVGIYGPVFICELGASENDTMISLFVLASVLLLIRNLALHDALSSRKGRIALIVAGALMGLAVGLKLTITIYAIGTAVALLFVAKNWSDRLISVCLWCAAFLVGFAITAGHWMATLYSAYGNPLFPFYNHIFQSPYFEATELVDRRYMPQTLFQSLTYPFQFFARTRFTYLSYDFRDSRYAVTYVLAILFLLSLLFRRVFASKSDARDKKKSEKNPSKWIRLERSERFLLLFFLVSYIIWQVQFSIIRYTATLEALAPVVILILALHIFPKRKEQSLSYGSAFVLGLAALLIVPTVKSVYHERLPWSPTFFEVKAPPLEDPAHTIVIIARDRPWGYLIPSFPPEVRFVSVRSNLTGPDHATRLQLEIRNLLAKHQGPIYVLSRREFLREDVTTLAAYQLAITSAEGRAIQSKHEKDGLALWPVACKEG
jgi:hypothetical protein